MEFHGYLLICVTIGLFHAANGQTRGDACAVNIVFCVDSSGSIWDDYVPRSEGRINWENIRTFTRNVVNQLDIGPDASHVGLVRFGNNAELIFNLNEVSKSESLRRIETLSYSGGRTNTVAALRRANEEMFIGSIFNRPLYSNIILILTDGKPTVDLNRDLVQVADAIKARDIRIIAVGVTDQVNVTQLLELVTNPATDYIGINDFRVLEQFIDQTINTVCETTTPGPQTCDACCVRTCDNRRPTCAFVPICPVFCQRRCTNRLRPFLLDDGTCGNANDCPQPCVESCQIDLVLIVDESGSVSKDSTDVGGPDYWDRDMAPFIRSLIASLEIGQNRNRIGLVMYNNRARDIWDLDDYTDKVAMFNAFDRINCRCKQGGQTNTSGAMRQAREMLRRPDSGNRDSVANVAILITDGEDNVETQNLFTEAALLKERARLIAVGVSNLVNHERLKRTVDNVTTDYFDVEQFAQLSNILDDLIRTSCNVCNDTDCPEPTPVAEVFAFHAYSLQTEFVVMQNTTIVFELTMTNFGNDYDVATGIFTCPCKGLYLFIHECSGIDCELGTVIMMDEIMISPIAYARYHGSISTSALQVCDKGQRVYVRIFETHDSLMSFNLNGMPTCAFKGTMIEPLA